MARLGEGLAGCFVENLGQAGDGQVLFHTTGSQMAVGLMRDGLMLCLEEGPVGARERGPLEGLSIARLAPISPGPARTYSVRVVFEGCEPVEPAGAGLLAASRSFLLGPDPSAWVSGARTYEEVWYRGLWEGVDLRFHFVGGRLKYDLLLDGGADPSRIVMRYEGSSGLRPEPSSGDLLVETPVGAVRDARPIVMQDGLPGGSAAAAFVPMDGDRVRFALPGECDPRRPLVIDPGLEFSTYLGGSEADDVCGVAVDGEGSVYVTGYTRSPEFPRTSGTFTPSTQNGFVAKLDDDCSDLAFSTIFGGDGDTQGRSLAVRGDGSILVVGVTASATFPTTTDGFDRTYNNANDVFILALSDTGTTVLYGSYFGGVGDDDLCYLNLSADGSIVLCGTTASKTLPTTPGAFCQTMVGTNTDAFLVRFGPSLGDLSTCTYFGGTSADFAYAACLDGTGTTYMAGLTWSLDLPCSPGAFCSTAPANRNAFVAALDPDWSELVLCTYICGNEIDSGDGIGVTPNGTVCVTGITSSDDFPISPDAFQTQQLGTTDAFLFLLSADGTERLYATFWGGSLLEEDALLCMDPANDRLIIVGTTRSTGLETTIGCYNPEYGGGANDLFLTAFDYVTHKMTYSTYFGGSGDPLVGIEAPVACIIHPDGGVLVAGYTVADDFPTTLGAHQRTYSDSMEGFVFRLTTVPASIPPAPTGLVATSGDGYIDLAWDPPSGQGYMIPKHRVYRGDSASSLSPYHDVLHANGYSDEGVVNGKYYWYAVSAVNSAGEGPLSTAVRARALGTPSEPLGLEGISNDGTVNLTWDPPSFDGGVEVLGYRIERGPFSDELAPYANVGNVTNFVDADVTLGEFYFYRVHAFNEKGEGRLSTVVRVKALDVPSAPPDFALEPGNAQVRLSWGMPTRLGGSMLLGFRVYRGPTPQTMTILATLGPMALEHTDMGLTNGQDYIYYVTAFSDVGESRMSIVLDAIPFTLPDQPRGLVARAGDRWVELAWEPPEFDGGRPVTHYNVFSSDEPGNLQLLVTIGAVTTFNNTGLTNGVVYYYQVQAVTEGGTSQRSTVASARPLGLPGAPSDLAGASVSGGVRLTWKAPANLGGADSLTYTVLRGAAADSLAVIATGVDALEYLDTGAASGQTYLYAVRAASAVGEGPLAGPVTVAAVSLPGHVLDLRAVGLDGKVHLTWMAPAEDGGSPITGYVVLRGLLETGMSEVAHVGAVLNYTDATVMNGKRYLYAVAAVNAVGTGPRGEVVDATPLGAPGAVGLLTASAKGGAIVLTWAAPAAAGRAPVTGYVVLRGDSADSLVQLADLGNVLTYTDSTVEEGRTYFYSVVPRSDVGDGQRAPSVTGKVPTLKDGPGPGAAAAAGALAALAACAIGRRRR